MFNTSRGRDKVLSLFLSYPVFMFSIIGSSKKKKKKQRHASSRPLLDPGGSRTSRAQGLMSFQLPAPGSIQQSIGVLNKPIWGGAGQLESLVHAQLHTWNIPQAGGRTTRRLSVKASWGRWELGWGRKDWVKWPQCLTPCNPPPLARVSELWALWPCQLFPKLWL